MKLTVSLPILASLALASCVSAQEEQAGGIDPRMLEASERFAEREREALAEDFIGVRTSDGLQDGLYPIRSTGVSTAPIVDAAGAFLGALSEEQRAKTAFAIDDEEWRKWLNVDNGIYVRQGVSLKEMEQEQKGLAFALMQASLSAHGLEQSRNIMKTDQTLKELNDNSPFLDEELYFFTIMGTPSLTEPWGWQIDGHHLAINYFVLRDQVVFAPVFMGAEPVFTTSGKHNGNVLFQSEQDAGLALMQSFNEAQRAAAMIGEKGRTDTLAAGGADNLVLDYEGLAASAMTKDQQEQLLALVGQYIGNMREGHANVKMEEVKAQLAQTHFGWKGGTGADDVFYYRIHSPVVLIEFDHQGPVGIRSPDGSRAATRNHIHTMIRTPNGNDYGKDLLRQHLEKHHSHDDGGHSHGGDRHHH